MQSLWKTPARGWARAFVSFRRIPHPAARVEEGVLARALSLSWNAAAVQPFVATHDVRVRHAQKDAWRAAWRARSGNLIVIDLRPRAEQEALPVDEAPLHAVSTGKLMRALELMPREQPAVLCVVTSDCLFLLDRKSCMRISGSLGALESVMTRLDAA